MKLILLSRYRIESLETKCLRDVELIFDDLIQLVHDGNTICVNSEDKADLIIRQNPLLHYRYKITLERLI